MKQTYYRTGQFARKAAVTERTLRFYDRIGLLPPSAYSESGYRLYSEEDFSRLQQILGLKYLGFSLEEIQRCLQTGPRELKDALAAQKAMLLERKTHLEKIILTIEETEARLDSDGQNWDGIVQIMEAIQMNEKKDWIEKYFSAEQQEKMAEISAAAYSEEDRAKLVEWGRNWTEVDQREADRKWGELYAGVRELTGRGADPGGPEAQALASRWMALVAEFTRGDPGITAGLKKFWQQMRALPEERAPIPRAFDNEQEAWWSQVQAIYQQRQNQT
jgi:DNA-binding transcriptional MerR regulator